MIAFDRDVALVRRGDDFTVEVPGHWRVARGGINGGYVAAAITRAFVEAVAAPLRQPRSLSVHYLSPCRPGPAQIAVRLERAGRSLSSLSGRMSQDGSVVALALATFGEARPGLGYQDEPMPEAPPPEAVPRLWSEGPAPRFASNWDHRRCVGPMPFSSAEEAVSGGWIRPAQPRLLDAPLLAAMADAWLPPVILRLPEPVRGSFPTVDLTVHFRASLPPPDMAPDDHCFVLFRSRVGAEGYWEADGVIWSRAGRVLAQARQLALLG